MAVGLLVIGLIFVLPPHAGRLARPRRRRRARLGLAVLLNLWVEPPVVLLQRHRRRASRAAGAGAAEHRRRRIPARAGDLARLRRAHPGRRGVGGAADRRRQARRTTSRDFIGQGAGNIAAGLFQGHAGRRVDVGLVAHRRSPVRKTRLVVLHRGRGHGARDLRRLRPRRIRRDARARRAAHRRRVPRAIKPSRIYSVVKSGPLPTAIMAVTFGLTLVIPLQFAVLVGVGLGHHPVRRAAVQPGAGAAGAHRRRRPDARDGSARCKSRRGEVVVLQPYGSLFFASAPIFERQLPAVSRESEGAS